MKSSGVMLLIVLVLDVFLFLMSQGMIQINPDSTIYGYDGTILEQLDAGDYNIKDTNPLGDLPTGEAVETSDSEFSLINIFSTTLGWFSEKIGLTYILNILNGVGVITNIMGLPSAVKLAVSGLWYGLTLFLLLSWLLGKE